MPLVHMAPVHQVVVPPSILIEKEGLRGHGGEISLGVGNVPTPIVIRVHVEHRADTKHHCLLSKKDGPLLVLTSLVRQTDIGIQASGAGSFLVFLAVLLQGLRNDLRKHLKRR